MKIIRSACIAALALLLASCQGDTPRKTPPAPEEMGRYIIGISFPTTDLIYRRTMKAIVEAEYPPVGDNPRARVIIRDGQNSQKKQNQDLMDMIAEGVDGIVIVPYTTEGPLPIVQYANNKGIPVIAVDNTLESSTAARFISYVGADHYEMGRQAAIMLEEALAERYPDKPRWDIIQLTGVPGSSGAIDRGRAIDEHLGVNARIHQLAAYNAEFTRDHARSVVADCLQLYDSIDGIICQNDLMAEGCQQAVEEAGRSGDILIIGIDGQRSVIERMAEGKIHGTVHQSPDMINAGVEVLCDYLDGKAVDEVYFQPIHRVYPGDAGRYLDEGLAW